MASAKIATLAIRTLAKPIATQIKQQAAEHPTFRRVCVGLAQMMHRVEMRMRSNLLGANTEHQKIRPLSENKAIANGANAISEGFLFAVAAALIIGESYRSSRSSAKQRNRTEEAVEEVRESLQELTRALGWSWEELEERRRVRKEVAAAEGQAGDGGGAAQDPQTPVRAALPDQYNSASDADLERERLQRAVQVLLQLALRSGWVQGQDALDLDAILTGRDEEEKAKNAEEAEEERRRRRRDDAAGAGVGQNGTIAAASKAGGGGASVQERIAALRRPSVVIVPSSPSEPVTVSDAPPESLS
ncbi:hypothetical protein OC842_002060 [Tilletia horrida]|uniref:OPA3-like protein n=1 Tax=Tilletia horrida TaxID=155126 RepID=A0AAN6GEG5_9BASI|nr:hypothetical protein OC842_002060 [Tilletia horrida]